MSGLVLIFFCLFNVQGLLTDDFFEVADITGDPIPADAADSKVIDCASVASLNLTINITKTYVHRGNVFQMYTQIQSVLSLRPNLTFIDPSIVSPDTLLSLVTSSQHYINDTVFVIEHHQDYDFYWCFLTSYYGNVTGDDNSTGLIPTEMPFILHGVMSLKEWSRLATRRAEAVLGVLKDLGWQQFIIIFEEKYENQVRVLVDITSKARIKSQLSDVKDMVTLKKNIRSYFDYTPDFHAVLITSYDTAQKVLKLAMTLEPELGKRISVSGTSKWLIFSQEGAVSRDSWMFQSSFDNVALIVDPFNLRQGRKREWLENDRFTILTLLYKTYGRELTKTGQVCRDWDLQLDSDVFPNVKFGFNGRLFVVTTNMWEPYVYRREVNGTYEYYGFCMDLAAELSRTLNFTIQYTEPPDGAWGAELPNSNGSWNGMVGQVMRQEVDMIMAPIGVTVQREKVVDFSFAFFYDDSAVIMKKPDPDKDKWRTYIDIFKQEVLLCIGAALVLGAAIITGVEWAEKYVRRDKTKVFAHTYPGSFWYLFGAMLNQGGRDLPTSASGRLFVSAWWLFCLVVVGTYSGNLIAVLTVTKDKPPFNTLAEMAEQDEYKFGTIDNSMWSTLFETSTTPEFQAINRKMRAYAAEDPNFLNSNPDVHLERVKQGSYAYIADKGLFQSWLAYNCDLMLLKEKFFPGKYAVVLPNNSVYTKLISDQVVKIYESGLLQVWIKKWWPKRSFCGGSLVTEAKTLTLIDVQSTFYLIGIGMVAGGLCLAFELLWDKMRSYKQFRNALTSSYVESVPVPPATQRTQPMIHSSPRSWR